MFDMHRVYYLDRPACVMRAVVLSFVGWYGWDLI